MRIPILSLPINYADVFFTKWPILYVTKGWEIEVFSNLTSRKYVLDGLEDFGSGYFVLPSIDRNHTSK